MGAACYAVELHFLDADTNIARQTTLYGFLLPRLAVCVFNVDAVKVVRLQCGELPRKRLGHVLRCVRVLHDRARLITNRTNQPAVDGEVCEPSLQRLQQRLLHRARRLNGCVVIVAARGPDGVQAIKLGHVQIVVGIADRVRNVDHPRHDVSRRRLNVPGATVSHWQNTSCLNRYKRLRLRGKPITAAQTHRHYRNAFVAGRRLQLCPQTVPLHAVLNVSVCRLGPDTAHPHLRAHHCWQRLAERKSNLIKGLLFYDFCG
ncbi:hypothetical protein D9M69_495520 [compost metagenome]